MHSKSIRILELLIRSIAISSVSCIPGRWSLTICPPIIPTEVSLMNSFSLLLRGPYEVQTSQFVLRISPPRCNRNCSSKLMEHNRK